MLINLKKILLYGLMFVILVTSSYFSWRLQNIKDRQSTDYSDIPDLVINNFDLSQYNFAGYRTYLLKGEQLTYFRGEKDSTIQQPKLWHYDGIITNPDKIDWQVTSREGVLTHDRAKLTLKDSVELTQTNQETQKATKINTELLFVYNQGERIESDQFVKITEESSYLTGIGLIGFPKKNEYTLLKEVKTHYVPTKSKPIENQK